MFLDSCYYDTGSSWRTRSNEELAMRIFLPPPQITNSHSSISMPRCSIADTASTCLIRRRLLFKGLPVVRPFLRSVSITIYFVMYHVQSSFSYLLLYPTNVIAHFCVYSITVLLGTYCRSPADNTSLL